MGRVVESRRGKKFWIVIIQTVEVMLKYLAQILEDFLQYLA
jgi:hypothetical protein